MKADKWDPSKSYSKGDYVIFSQRLYHCIKKNIATLPIPIIGNTGLGSLFSNEEVEMLEGLCKSLSKNNSQEVKLNTNGVWEIV